MFGSVLPYLTKDNESKEFCKPSLQAAVYLIFHIISSNEQLNYDLKLSLAMFSIKHKEHLVSFTYGKYSWWTDIKVFR